MKLLEKAADYVLEILAENEEVKKFPKDFVTASMQWIRSWFLIDDPVTTSIIQNKDLPNEVKKPVIEAKITTLQNNSNFLKELEERIALFSIEKQKIQNIIKDSEIDVQGNFRQGDSGTIMNPEVDEKNKIKKSKISVKGDFKQGDGL